ncbi:phospho-acceptor domain-containing protein [Archangium gephyra]|uniref:histidine kinase n=1 Tax=Archangium gephyra TaxID=48 RepID=A0AAC8TFF8_9BACT|nr:ATP-binding protein [Archangium gephyra]AKJ03825.1 sensory box sensor histidine kinase [Archangium gephyra]REG23604.1 phospho-acceptor domain-containing protein [Archangium gephyra]
MDTQASVASVADSERVQRGIQGVAGMGAAATNLALLVSVWGQWPAVYAVVGVSVVLTLVNAVLAERLALWLSRARAEAIRTGINAAGICLIGIAARWPALVWVFVPYNMLWYFGLDPWVRPRMALYLVAIDGVALATGAEPATVLSFSLIGLFGYLVSEKRGALLTEKNAELAKAHQELQQLHQRALEQERLSSLGLMAASVAHEINNPMSYVTSNVDSLLQDMRDEPNLSAPLKEYVDDVLPATLDGIKRVNSIVSDLRRFSRGGYEGYSSYDFNAEVRTALRIARIQLGHVRVEQALEEVGQVVGRPRQIVQVLVNLLVNAGQATPSGGVVRLAIRNEGALVRVEVRDTGSGMSEETKRHLFEPFFTTKPVGLGTGLGLSVVHGIIKAHGGRIEVESELGKGTCFTIDLPKVPTLPPETSSGGNLRAAGR